MSLPHPRFSGHRSPLRRVALALGFALAGVAQGPIATPAQPPREADIPALVVAQAPSPAQPQPHSPRPQPPLPPTIPEAAVPPRSGIVGINPAPTADLGIGLLHPQNLSFLETTDGDPHPLTYGRWLRSVALPLYASPNGDPWGWIVNGWLMINGYEPLAIGRDASFSMVEAHPGLYSFPVLEQRPDGWLRFQYTAAGSAWTHRDYLHAGAIPLTIQPWEGVLSSASHLRFRQHGLSQALRSGPSTTASLQSLIVPNSHIRILALEEDWVQVEVTQPVQGCTALPGHRTQTGWLRWRDDETQALLVWPASPPCPATEAE
ncbi:MAG: hypothetical protein VKI82_16365 [Leptolyngbya sp.]|nr:hypothetical protein [Leptolyngbya sp.]